MIYDIINIDRNKTLDPDLQILQDENNATYLQRFYDHEFLTAEGIVGSYAIKLADAVWDYVQCVKDNGLRKMYIVEEGQDKDLPERSTIYIVSGAVMNHQFHLTGDNAYPDDFHLMVIDSSDIQCTAMVKETITFGENCDSSFRYFSDVVDNNARREILKCNAALKDYHSLYGDKWFWSSVLECAKTKEDVEKLEEMYNISKYKEGN